MSPFHYNYQNVIECLTTDVDSGRLTPSSESCQGFFYLLDSSYDSSNIPAHSMRFEARVSVAGYAHA